MVYSQWHETNRDKYQAIVLDKKEDKLNVKLANINI